MSKKDPLTDVRRDVFREWCREMGWVGPGDRWLITEISRQIGKSYNTTSNILNGHGSFGATAARDIEAFRGLSPGFFDGRDDSEFVDVPRINAKLSAGSGAIAELEEVIGNLKFNASFLRACGVSPASARVVDVKGPSMEPTIKDGAVLLISTRNKEPIDNCIFALVRPAEGLIVKRLKRKQESWFACSDNLDFGEIQINDGEPISIVGRAIWMGAKL